MTEALEDQLAAVGGALIKVDPIRARDLFNKLTSAAWSAMADTADEGGARLVGAQQRQEAFDRIAAMVAARHGVSLQALVGTHKARQKPHVVDARAHLVAELYTTGLFSYPMLASRLGYKTHHTAMHLHDKWKARRAGTDDAVTDREAIEAHRLVREEGLTLRQAADRLEINHAKLRGRISWMRETGAWAKAEAANEEKNNVG